jgi:hypothetical protein
MGASQPHYRSKKQYHPCLPDAETETQRRLLYCQLLGHPFPALSVLPYAPGSQSLGANSLGLLCPLAAGFSQWETDKDSKDGRELGHHFLPCPHHLCTMALTPLTFLPTASVWPPPYFPLAATPTRTRDSLSSLSPFALRLASLSAVARSGEPQPLAGSQLLLATPGALAALSVKLSTVHLFLPHPLLI